MLRNSEDSQWSKAWYEGRVEVPPFLYTSLPVQVTLWGKRSTWDPHHALLCKAPSPGYGGGKVWGYFSSAACTDWSAWTKDSCRWMWIYTNGRATSQKISLIGVWMQCTGLRWNGLWVAQVQEVSLFRMKHLCFTLMKTVTGLGSKIHLPLSLANLC